MSQTKIIAIGELDIVSAPDILKTTVGSCIALILYDKTHNVFGMAHIMLPSAEGAQTTEPGKYADTAIMELLSRMRISVRAAHRLQAKLAGGAHMFAGTVKEDKLRVGDKNREAVVDILNHLKVPILGVDYGGNVAREVWIETSTHKVFVKKVGETAREL